MGKMPGGIARVTLVVVGDHAPTSLSPWRRALDGVAPSTSRQVVLASEASQASPAVLWRTIDLACAALEELEPECPQPAGGEVQGSHWVVVAEAEHPDPADLLGLLLTTAQLAGPEAVVLVPPVESPAGSGRHAAPDGPAQRLQHAILGARGRRTSRLDGCFAVRRSDVPEDDVLDAEVPSDEAALDPVPTAADARRARLHIVEPSGDDDAAVAASTDDVREDDAPDAEAAPAVVALPKPRRRGLATAARAAAFAAVGATGLVVNSLALWFFVDVVGLVVAVGAVLATQVSTLWNFFFVDTLVFRGAKSGRLWKRLLGFAVVNNLVLLLRLPLLAWLVSAVGVGYLWANLVTLLIAFLARFLISDRYLFRPRSTDVPVAREEPAVDLVVDGEPFAEDVDLRGRADDPPGAPGGAGGGPAPARLAVPA